MVATQLTHFDGTKVMAKSWTIVPPVATSLDSTRLNPLKMAIKKISYY